MKAHCLCALLAVALAFAGKAEAQKEPSIIGLWSKVESPIANATALGWDEAFEKESLAYTLFSPTPNSKIFTFVWVNLAPPPGNISETARNNGPSAWAPQSGANMGSYGMAVKTGPYTYDLIAAPPFTSGTGVISDDGKQMSLFAIGQGKRGAGDAGVAFRGLHRVQTLRFPKKA